MCLCRRDKTFAVRGMHAQITFYIFFIGITIKTHNPPISLWDQITLGSLISVPPLNFFQKKMFECVGSFFRFGA